MHILRSLVVVGLTVAITQGQPAPQSKSSKRPKQPAAMIRSLYREVIARQPHGIPEGRDMKILAPYLSKGLRRRIDAAAACYEDWIRQNPNSNLKAPFGWWESGFFSGDDERASPTQFQIEKLFEQKDKSLLAYLRLSWQEQPPASWRVALVVRQENSNFVVDDVIFLKDKDRLIESRLSEYLSSGCDGSRWVGLEK
jgi:hypothetical protein